MPAHASRTLAPAPSAPPSGPERRLLAPAPPGERRHARRTLRQPGSPPLQASIGGFEVKELLGIPGEIQIVYAVPLGYPRGNFGPVTRKPLAEVASIDRWDNAIG